MSHAVRVPLRRIASALAAPAAGAALLFGAPAAQAAPAGSAQAEPAGSAQTEPAGSAQTEPAGSAQTEPAGSLVWTSGPECAQLHAADPVAFPSAARCAAATVSTTVTSRQVSPALLGGDAGLVASDGTGLGPAAATRTVYFRQWSQKLCFRFSCTVWNEKHEFGWYTDGYHVWLRDHFGFNNGYHRCNINSGVGFDVSINTCHTYYDPASNGSTPNHIKILDSFRVSFLFKGVPIYATHDQWVNAYGGGGAYPHYN